MTSPGKMEDESFQYVIIFLRKFLDAALQRLQLLVVVDDLRRSEELLVELEGEQGLGHVTEERLEHLGDHQHTVRTEVNVIYI